jgi:hypothetical protein
MFLVTAIVNRTDDPHDGLGGEQVRKVIDADNKEAAILAYRTWVESKGYRVDDKTVEVRKNTQGKRSWRLV